SKQTQGEKALAFAGDQLIAGRLDGSVEAYAVADGKPVAFPSPKVSAAEPRGIQRGTADVRLMGENLNAVKSVSASNPAVRVEIVDASNPKLARDGKRV